MCTILITVYGEFLGDPGKSDYSNRIFLNTVHTTIVAQFSYIRIIFTSSSGGPVLEG